MTIPEVQKARDYNRGLPAPIRWVHTAAAALAWAIAPVRSWADHPQRRAWAKPLFWGLLVAVALGFFDGAMTRQMRSSAIWLPHLAGALTFGVVVMSILVAAAIWLQDPQRRGRIFDWAWVVVLAVVVCRVVSMLVGRPRPRLDDPGYFINPLGSYPLNAGRGIAHSWEFWRPGVWDLWSMPSMEAALAAVGAVVVAAAYPRLRLLAWLIAACAAVGVVLTGLGYASDAAVGMMMGAIAGRLTLRRTAPSAA